MKVKRKAGLITLAFLIAFITIANISIKSEDIKNWNNANYWSENPKSAYPIWFCYITDKTRTTELIGEGNIIYVHKFEDRPNDVIFYNASGAVVTIVRPDGRIIKLRLPKKEEISLNIYGKYSIVSQLNIPPQKAALKTATFLLFSSYKDLEVLKGKYIFKINGTNKTIRIVIKGNCYGIFGTDKYGRDMWVGFIAGTNNTILLTLLIGGSMLIFGIIIGIASAYNKLIDFILEVIASTPMLPFFMILVWLVSTQGIGYNVNISTIDFVLILTILSVGRFAKSIKSITLKERAMEYTKASISLGADENWIIRRHILKPVLEFSLRHVTFIIAKTISLVSILGFFGLSPGVNWGSYMIELMREGVLYGNYWWIVLTLVLMMGVLSLSLALISERLPESYG
ncbi:ABC transporter permease [Pyrococcus horikoshii]|uniref:ABC transmembrane type-1 domain-containing protein n=2 Tax=Pyrococcus horikoshii TaxID=53953 RepID=O59482_PYRHO|nr:ABC transporter permease [Pyrococcus horikoshii]BAA30937.1 398aa long hypothetical protein [Pyrococcus horikoshii OT3]HII60776.1 ABC transporter permease [Pyrococcus horikoshii]